MQLIDHLEQRAEDVRLVENVLGDSISVALTADNSYITIQGANYVLSPVALETYLNLIKVPIKMVYRCIDNDGAFVAETLVNFWIRQYDSFSFLVEIVDDSPTVTQVFSGNGFYLPSVKVNDLIIDYLGGNVKVESFTVEEDVYEAIYLTSKTIVSGVDGEKFRVGVRVLYSDCFTLTPRFDGILYGESGAIFSVPTAKRKFRVAGSTIPQILQQIREFLELSIGYMSETLIPRLESIDEFSKLDMVFPHNHLKSICTDLRLSRKVLNELTDGISGEQMTEYGFVKAVTSFVANHHTEEITIKVAREIEEYLTDWYLR